MCKNTTPARDGTNFFFFYIMCTNSMTTVSMCFEKRTVSADRGFVVLVIWHSLIKTVCAELGRLGRRVLKILSWTFFGIKFFFMYPDSVLCRFHKQQEPLASTMSSVSGDEWSDQEALIELRDIPHLREQIEAIRLQTRRHKASKWCNVNFDIIVILM